MDFLQAEVSRRLSSAKETVNRSTGLQSHEDLAKKLQVLYYLNFPSLHVFLKAAEADPAHIFNSLLTYMSALCNLETKKAKKEGKKRKNPKPTFRQPCFV